MGKSQTLQKQKRNQCRRKLNKQNENALSEDGAFYLLHRVCPSLAPD